MVLTVTVVAVTAGAVAEFQLGIGHIGPSADAAPMGKVRCVTLGAEGDGACLRCPPLLRMPLPTGTTGDKGKQVQNIPSREDQITGETYQREQVMGEGMGISKNIQTDHQQVNNAHEPGLYRDEIEDQKLGIGMGGGEHQKHT